MTDYIILAEETAIKLRWTVLEYASKGWRLAGGPGYDSNRKEFFQAMVK